MDWPSIIPNRPPMRIFGPDEIRHLERLRRYFQLNPDIFTGTEVSKLLFMRWLVHTGRLQAG